MAKHPPPPCKWVDRGSSFVKWNKKFSYIESGLWIGCDYLKVAPPTQEDTVNWPHLKGANFPRSTVTLLKVSLSLAATQDEFLVKKRKL